MSLRGRRRSLVGDDEAENFWPAFADLTSTIALMLFVLVLLAYIQNLISGKNLSHTQAELARTLSRLQGSQRQITTAENRLRLLAAEIEAGQARLALSEQRVEQQQEVIAQSTRELGELRGRLEGIAVLRLDLLKKVKESIETQLGSADGTRAPVVSIADNGNIIIDESLLFEYDSHSIKRDGKKFLDTLAAAFAAVLADPGVRANIDAVHIQGHTDERGSVSYNRELAARRANAVLDYMFEAHESLERDHGSFFASSAYSEFRPIDPGKSETSFRRNRRIEISVVLKDASVRALIDDYMRGIDPALQNHGAAQP